MRLSSFISLAVAAVKFAVAFIILFLVFWIVGYQLIYRTILKGKRQFHIKMDFPNFLLLIFTLIIFYATQFRQDNWISSPRLIPFSSYLQTWYQFNRSEWSFLILNILMFVPFGFVLPWARKTFRRAWKVYLTGFAFSLLVEILQFVFKRGIFEVDDLINNTLGTILGYGLFVLVQGIILRKVTKKLWLCQLPFVLTFGIIISAIYYYNTKEYGNFIYEDIIKHDSYEITCDKEDLVSSEETALPVYKTIIASLDETRQYANDLFALQGDAVDDSKTDVYAETVIYYSVNGNLSAWIGNKGLTVDYKNFDYLFPGDGLSKNYLTNAKEDRVRVICETSGFDIPESANFSVNENEYCFEIKGEEDGKYYSGSAKVALDGEGHIMQMVDNIISGEVYKNVDCISSQEALDMVKDGLFFAYEGEYPTEQNLTLKKVNLIYVSDSKGFVQPVYELVLLNAGDEQYVLHIPARKK